MKPHLGATPHLSRVLLRQPIWGPSAANDVAGHLLRVLAPVPLPLVFVGLGDVPIEWPVAGRTLWEVFRTAELFNRAGPVGAHLHPVLLRPAALLSNARVWKPLLHGLAIPGGHGKALGAVPHHERSSLQQELPHLL